MNSLPEYAIYAVKYAHAGERTRNDGFLFKDPHDLPMPLDYFVWAIVGNGKTYIVDLGFEAIDGRRRGRELIRLPSEGLAMLGIDCAGVEDVIVTHMHYDHAGTLADFPNARVYLQEREMAYATGPNMTLEVLRRPFNVDYVCELVKAVYDERVEFIAGDREIAPGISVHHIGGHTDGLQSVRVWTRKGWMMLASDALHFYANMGVPNPFPIVYNVGDMVRGYDRLRSLADHEHNIVPGHDPKVHRYFAAADKTLAGTVIRLDADCIDDMNDMWLPTQ